MNEGQEFIGRREMEFRGIEKTDDGVFKAVYYDGDKKFLLSEEEVKGGPYRLKTVEGALDALGQANSTL